MPNMRDDASIVPTNDLQRLLQSTRFPCGGMRGLEMCRKPHKCFAVLYCLRQTIYRSTRSNTTNAPARPASWVKLK